jgi:hypothetical protein
LRRQFGRTKCWGGTARRTRRWWRCRGWRTRTPLHRGAAGGVRDVGARAAADGEPAAAYHDRAGGAEEGVGAAGGRAAERRAGGGVGAHGVGRAGALAHERGPGQPAAPAHDAGGQFGGRSRPEGEDEGYITKLLSKDEPLVLKNKTPSVEEREVVAPEVAAPGEDVLVDAATSPVVKAVEEAAAGGAKGVAKVTIEPHHHKGVFVAKGKEDALVTKNLVPGESVRGADQGGDSRPVGRVVSGRRAGGAGVRADMRGVRDFGLGD